MMKADLEDEILRLLDDARQEPRSRGTSLCITKLEEALFWLREGRKEAAQNTMHTGHSA